jgi:deoxyribodipyrimidine photo-lyase
MNTLLWFQRDLRLKDNDAFSWALQQGKPIIAFYIHSPEEDAPWTEGAASRWWLHHSLHNLRKDLLQFNIELQFFCANSQTLIPKLAEYYIAGSIAWTSRHEPARVACESEIETRLQQKGIIVKRYKDELLVQPDKFLTVTNNTPYRVFTPFYKRLRRELGRIQDESYNPVISNYIRPKITNHSDALTLDQLNLLDTHPWHKNLHQYWAPGEHSAAKKLQLFIDKTLEHYTTQRDYPALKGTSELSPHLHFGEISPRQVLDVLIPIIEFDQTLSTAAEGFLRQLIWREFARYILYYFPETSSVPMNKKFTSSFWKEDPDSIKNWRQGKTGIDIIDAGMKQLWETGYMHNRVRMLVASLLTKNMGIRWQDGAQWFWETLVDADLANNSMGWQWVAGCGVDAAPYFRIFNPDTQARRFDPECHYINRWLKHNKDEFTETPRINLVATRQDALNHYNHMIRGQR